MKAQWFNRLERRLGFLSIPGLAAFIVGMNALIWALTMFRPDFPSILALDPALVMQGQLWRVFTFLFIPPPMAPLWMIFWLWILYMYAIALEQEWGDFHFTLFYGIGAIAAIAAALLTQEPISNITLNLTIFLAFAALYPDFELLLFFILPVKVKWLAWLAWAGIAWNFLTGYSAERVSLALGLSNYALFFGPSHWENFKLKIHVWRNRRKWNG